MLKLKLVLFIQIILCYVGLKGKMVERFMRRVSIAGDSPFTIPENSVLQATGFLDFLSLNSCCYLCPKHADFMHGF